MKKCLWLLLLCPVLAVGQSAPVVPNWCAQQQSGLSQTAWQVFSLPNLSCIQLNPAWSGIDTGTVGPSFHFENYDPTGLTPYTGWSLGACTTSGGTSTCNILSGTWTIIQNATIIISGSAGCDGTYTAGTNGSTFVHITSGCTSASGGKLLIACGANLAQGAAPCKLVIMSAMTDAAGVQNNAAYPFSQAYANSSCPAWQTGVTYGFNSCVTHGGHFQHVVNIPALTAQCTDISFGSFCLWNDDGATNAFVQEAVVGPSFQGNANAPNVFVSGGAVFSVTSNNCQPSESSACLATDVATGFPVYWETPMQAALKTWCTGVDGSSNLGFMQHYNSVVPAGQLLALECGAPQGVEWFFAMEGFFEAKYSMNLSQTESLLVNYASNNLWSSIHTEWVALGSPSWGMLVPDGIYSGCPSDQACSLYSDLLASVSLQYAENSPGNYGLRAANITTYLATGTTRGHWVENFAKYPNTKFHVLEPFSPSCPNVISGPYNPSLCNPLTQGVTGDYRTILPFATQFISTGTAQPIFILFEDDVACTYDAGITITVSGGSYPPCINAPYTLPMANAAAGIFAGTTVATGITGSFTISGPGPVAPLSAALPLLWVDNNEATDGLVTPPSFELSLPSTWITGPPPGCTFHAPYAITLAGLQSAVNDMEACRTSTATGIILDVPPGLYTTANALGLVIPQSNTLPATSFLIMRSTQDVNLPNGRTVCAHGIQDNLATSTDIGLINPDCAGDRLTYQLGTTIFSIPAGAFTLADGTITDTAAYNDAQYMYTLESSGGNPSALTFCSPLGLSSTSHPPLCAATVIGPDHWLIEDAEVRMSAGNLGNQFVLDLQLAGNETNIAQLATHIHLRKVWVHGDWINTSTNAGSNQISSDIEFDCLFCSVVDSQTSESLRPGAEGHALTAQGQGPYKFDHNWLEGQASGIFSGGFSLVTPFAIAGYMPFQDVELRRNRLTFPYTWLGLNVVSGGHWIGASIDRKNALETKNGARVLERGNIIENSDTSGGQSGVLADWNVRQFRTNYQNTLQDFTIARNIFRNGCEGIQFANSAPSQGNGGGIAFNLRRINFANNLLYNLDPNNPGCTGVLSQGLAASNSGWIFQGTVTENPSGTGATFVPTCSASAGPNGTNGGNCPGQVNGFSITAGGTGCVAGNLVISAPPPGGIQAAGTYSCTSGALSSVTITNEGLQYTSAPTAAIATGSGTLTLTIRTTPGGLIAGSEVMDLSIGDPIALYNCPNVAAFNLPLTNFTIGSFYWPNILGPRASAVSNVIGNPSVTFPFATTANATDNSGYCTVITTPGAPQNFSVTHNTIVSNSAILPSSNNTAGPGPNFAMNWEMQNNIFISAASGTGWNSNRGEGTPTEIFNYDILSLTADHNVWPGRTGSKYTSYGNNPSFPVPLPVMYFPANSAAVGFSCLGCSTSVPLNLIDYHGYSLAVSSPYHNGGSDGTDIGPNLTTLDTALTQNLFVCGTACGSGPYPDVPAPAPFINSLDDTLQGWQFPPCIGPPCAGGVGNPSSWSQTINNPSPSLDDGESMLLTETGTNYSNLTWVYSFGVDNSATSFTGSFTVLIPDETPFQSFGPDMYQFISGTSYMFGTECDMAGTGAPFWHVWNELTGSWIATADPCLLTAGVKHTVVFKAHRVAGDTNGCSGHPCMYYDSLTIDGVQLGPYGPYPAGNRAVGDASGIQFDLNSNSVGGTLNAYIDSLTYTPKP